MIKQAKTEYYTNVIEQNKSNRKMLWDYLRVNEGQIRVKRLDGVK